MTRVSGVLLALVLMATAGWGQTVITTQLTFQGNVPGLVSGISAAPAGLRGSVDIYYRVTARYPAGVTTAAGPARATGTVGIAALAAPSAIRISWQAAPGATGYDVIRQPTAAWTGACVNCVVSSNQAGTTFLDIGGAVVNWPTAGTVPAAGHNIVIVANNRDDNYPFLQLGGELHIAPVRSTLDYAYLVEIVGPSMTGGAVQKTYALGINVSRPTTAVATGDSNDALLRGSYNNYAQNDANFIVRGVNTLVTGRSPGTLGMLDNLISASNRSGATAPIVNGLTVNVENYGVNADQHSGIDVSLKNEAAKATKEWGVRLRNLNNSIGGPSDAVLLVEEPGLANTGWNFIIDANGVKSPTHAFARLQNGSVVYYGTQTTRDTVRTEVGTGGAIGSMYVSTTGKIYLKIANANATADWTSLTGQAAD